MNNFVLDENHMATLDAMSFAPNYHQWIFDEFKPFMGKKIAEVGAGTGSFTNYLLTATPETLYSIEPSSYLYPFLLKTANEYDKNSDTKTELVTLNNFLSNNVEKLENKVDTVVYINVLEHIEKDVEELKLMYKLLKNNGHIMIFVPALQWIYGTHDKNVGHFRRYYKNELKQKVEEAGFEIQKIKYFDVMGIIPWWFSFRVLKIKYLNNGQAGIYDKFVVPITRFIEKIWPPVAGKNLLLVAKKVY